MPPELTDVAWVQIRHDYEHTEKPVEDICIEHCVSPGTLRDRMRRWRWTRRRQPIPPDGPPPTPAPQIEHPLFPAIAQTGAAAPTLPAAPQADPACVDAAPGEAASDPALIVPRLQGAVARVLPAIEAVVGKLAAGPMQPREMERAARALSSLTRALRELNALLSQYPAPAASDRGPADDDEFIRDLARRMDYFAATRAAADEAKPEDSGSSSAAL